MNIEKLLYSNYKFFVYSICFNNEWDVETERGDTVKWMHLIYKEDGLNESVRCGNGKREMCKWKAWDVQIERTQKFDPGGPKLSTLNF